MTTKIASFWNDFVDILLPRICPACKGVMVATEYQLCTTCLLTLPRIIAGGLTENQVETKFIGFREVETVRAFLEYHPGGKVQALLRALKYEGNKEIAFFLGKLTAQEWKERGGIPDADFLVPVPLHLRKQKERGYNQSEAFARGFSEISSIPVDDSLLKREVYTPSQTGKTKVGRIAAMQGVFSVRAGVDLSALRIILMDDVLTTGATLEACVSELVKGKCRQVHVIAIAAAQN